MQCMLALHLPNLVRFVLCDCLDLRQDAENLVLSHFRVCDSKVPLLICVLRHFCN
jgi:hypothetical protein